ncbi:1,4-alpha-glucan branching protein GlgB [Pseudohalioglobus sediminis]|uniref:1,4-alpha-glucan branching enzyme GlgB n=1 Tax=Pseudohalioglobus sediminis TaxID=2606449 RepID=A0A5B0WRS8_9GAMM|nr:1,4-alpha-glucan branching protein GlgB [Pseudohalioglobus sediminis]KAA1189158.1 1,4-alpha-glucan branching protein GlgB [Pseudohalioglobus sediminis]
MKKRRTISDAARRLLAGHHHDPFDVLGCHRRGRTWHIKALLPGAAAVEVVTGDARLPMERTPETDLFSISIDCKAEPAYRLRCHGGDGNWREFEDPYRFGTLIGDLDLHLFAEGRHQHLYRILGAHCCRHEGVTGVRFATWAPNATRVSVVGDFNGWHGLAHPMRVRGGSGVWELFIPGLAAGSNYKFEVRDQQGALHLKADPYGNAFELRPATASVVQAPSEFTWSDADWLQRRAHWDWQRAPVSVYELQLASWRRAATGEVLNYREIAPALADYVTDMGFTHVELLPITEFPLDESWGYQPTGYFAPTSRFGAPDDFRYFVDYLHSRNIGVILDWVPAHFPRDAHGLARFDGTALYEHADPRRGEHADWGTLIFNYGRNEVRNFLLASASFWLEEFHLDGLRVDAVASMLYLDYSREEGEWAPNEHGGNENLEAIAFLRELNTLTHGAHPGTLTIAEESTAWPQVTRPTWVGGLGFSMKWNMGWMHDSLNYMAMEPIYRHYHHDKLTFGLMYAFSENFMLPFSHDEVVHGKRSLLGRMPGDDWQRFANLRLLYTYMFTYPGTKLLFMGCELADPLEWRHAEQLNWALAEQPAHAGVQHLVRDLNQLYRRHGPLHGQNFTAQGFEWIDCNDATQSVLAYLRRDGERFLVVVLNFTPVVRADYRVGVPEQGVYREVFNSDSHFYGGSNVSNGTHIAGEASSWMGRPASLVLTLPPLAGIVLQWEPAGE